MTATYSVDAGRRKGEPLPDKAELIAGYAKQYQSLLKSIRAAA